MYRVRKTWADESSQIGAYELYQNAVDKVDQNPTYTAFNDYGRAVYPVRTMSYKAKLIKPIGSIAKGTTVRVTRDRHKNWVLSDGTIVPDKSYLDLTKQIYDPTWRIANGAAAQWINDMKIGSDTGWLIWCNKYGQRIYIFKGKKGKWSYCKSYKCGTGNIEYGDGSDQGVGFGWKIYDKQKEFHGPRGIQYWNMHYSSPWGNSIHQGTTGKPSTHGCIALGGTAARWVYVNVPINSRVVVF